MTNVYDPALAQLAQQIVALQGKVAQLERNQRSASLPNSSIDNGAITVNDASGTAALVVGLQPDGTYSTSSVTSATPAQAPSDPVVNGFMLGLLVTWDGRMADGTAPLTDFSDVEVHCSLVPNFTPDVTTIQGSMTKAGFFFINSLLPNTTYYVVLLAVNEAGNTGPLSNYVTATPTDVPTNIPGGGITSTLIAAGAIVAGLIAAGAIDGLVLNGNILNAAQIFGDIVVLSGANDGVFTYGQPPATVKVFTSINSTMTWVCPGGVTSVDVYAIGAGGGGAGGTTGRSGAGGGGGGVAVNAGVAVTPGNTYYIRVNSAGSGGAAGASGGNGGTSWFNSISSQGTFFAGGGNGGVTNVGGTGGTPSGGTSGFNGGNGGNGSSFLGSPYMGGGGGGGAGDASVGGNGGLGTTYGTGGVVGPGGTGSYINGGSGGHGGDGVVGHAGTGPGGGGGGGGGSTGGGSAGGPGAAGRVILVYSAAAATLITAQTGLAGIDPVNGLSVPQGFYGPALELVPVSTPVPANTSDAVLYASLAGALAARNDSGFAGAVGLSIPADFTVRTVAVAANTQISGPLFVAANDMAVGTTYVLTCAGTGTWGSATGNCSLSIWGQVDTVNVTGGGGIGNIAVGAVNSSTTFRWQATVTIICKTTGSTGTVEGWANGFVQSSAGDDTAAAFNINFQRGADGTITVDTTVSHNLAIWCTWGGTTGSPTISGNMTTFQRFGA
jgi:hypothetical protein